MWIVMKIQDFEFEPTTSPISFIIETGKMVGYIPVYNTLEDAKEEFPNADYCEVREKEK